MQTGITLEAKILGTFRKQGGFSETNQLKSFGRGYTKAICRLRDRGIWLSSKPIQHNNGNYLWMLKKDDEHIVEVFKDGKYRLAYYNPAPLFPKKGFFESLMDWFYSVK